MWLGLIAGALLNPLDLGAAGGRARVALGAVLVVYGIWGLARPALPDLGRRASWVGALEGSPILAANLQSRSARACSA